MTIVEAIKEILQTAKESFTVDEIYTTIVSRNLYSFKAIDPRAVVRSQLRRHCIGLNFPTASPVKYFRLAEDDHYLLESINGVRTTPADLGAKEEGRVPEEVIDSAHKEHLLILRQQLKAKILENHPAFFERLVIDLLIKMGYGGSDPALGIHTGGPGDAGIDGIINEDKLGLEKIYIQAKRYALNREVTRVEVQRFAGAMNKANKGVFITTAAFAAKAKVFAASHQKSIRLVDGDLLCTLMILHGVGVSEVTNYRVSRVDSDYFSPTD